MRICGFCHSKIRMTMDYCSFCGSASIIKRVEIKKIDFLLSFIESVKKEGFENTNLNDYNLLIDNWKMPYYFEAGIKVETKSTVSKLLSESYLLVFGLVFLNIGILFYSRIMTVFTSAVSFIYIILRHFKQFDEALKFDNPFNVDGHEIRYNHDNSGGGRGAEEFVIRDDVIEFITLYYDEGELFAINFSRSLKTLVKVNNYQDKGLLERFIYFYACKYNKKILILENESIINEVKKHTKFNFIL